MAINIIHVGAGIRGTHWLHFAAQHPDIVSVACVDADPKALERARGVAGEGCRTFPTLAEAIAAMPSAQAALIASPSALHVEHAITAIEAGLSVLIEKPFAETVADARRVLEAARRHGKQVVVAENYRYWPAERTVRAWVKDGRLGKIDNVTLVDRRNMPSHTEGPWLAKMEYPQLREIAIHHFDSLRSMLLAEATSVAANVWNSPGSDYRHGCCTAATIRMGETRVQYLGTMTSPRYSFSLKLEGEKGEIWTNRKYVFWRPRGKRFFKYIKNVAVPSGDERKYPQGGTTSLLNALRDAVERGQVAETSGEDNIGTLAIVEAALRSDAERRTVDIAEVL